MKPLRLTMSAFGSYASEEVIDFERMERGLFLVTGDTGAGKTTIFDGIVYALYDRTSGGVRDGNMMRSAYADLRTPTCVELTFLCRGERYRIVRNPDYERASLRRDSEGKPRKTQEKSKVELYFPDGSQMRGTKKEINARIEEILGLTPRQFMQVAMIAQGDFLKLLHAKSEERREIFSQLFDTGLYARVQEELRRREKEAYGGLKNKEQAIGEQMARILIRDGVTEAEQNLMQAKESMDLEGVQAFLRQYNHQESEIVRELESRLETLRQQEQAQKKRQELTGELRSLEQKQAAREEWLNRHLSQEPILRKEKETAEVLLEQAVEKTTQLQKKQEQLLREYEEGERGLKDHVHELRGLLELFRKLEEEEGTAREAAGQWEAAHEAYRGKQREYEVLYEAFFREQAGILAQSLKTGIPCPVCGSLEHPQKARASTEAPDQEQVRSAARAVKAGEKKRDQAQLYFQQKEQTLREAKGSLTQEGKRLLGEGFSCEEKEGALWRSRSEQALLEQEQALLKQKKTYEQAREQLRTEGQSLQTRQRELESRLKKAETQLEQLIRQLERIQGEKETLTLRQQEIKTQLVQLTGSDRWDFEKHQEELQELQGQLKSLEEEYRQRYSALQSNEKTCAMLEDYHREYQTQQEAYTLIRHLSQTAGGTLAGTARVDFESYIQRKYFRRIIHRANERLMQMSSGQFLLKCRDMDQLSGRGRSGLELDVYSLVTESVRDVKTLSGGESFMAALSMALGLADVIGESVGAVRLETLFIDEGFGSLDENAREQAIRVLNELAGEHRVIGVISHVTELKEQIETKLLVQKTKKGSRTVWTG